MPYSNRNSVQSKEDWKADGGGGVSKRLQNKTSLALDVTLGTNLARVGDEWLVFWVVLTHSG